MGLSAQPTLKLAVSTCTRKILHRQYSQFLTRFEFSRDDKKTVVSANSKTETLRSLKGRCCNALSSEVFLLRSEDHAALVTTKTKVLQVTIGPGNYWVQSYNDCKDLTVAEILFTLTKEGGSPPDNPIQLKFTLVDIAQPSADFMFYNSE